jgi:hypothetical protein
MPRPQLTQVNRYWQIQFPPGMADNDIHPNALADLHAFAEDVGCTVTKADELKAFVFRKRS